LQLYSGTALIQQVLPLEKPIECPGFSCSEPSPLFYAVFHEDIGFIHLILEPCNWKSPSDPCSLLGGTSALHIAVRRKSLSALRALLQKLPKFPTVRDSTRTTALDLARELRWEEGVAMLEAAKQRMETESDVTRCAICHQAASERCALCPEYYCPKHLRTHKHARENPDSFFTARLCWRGEIQISADSSRDVRDSGPLVECSRSAFARGKRRAVGSL
jgi:hypothetical protein